MCLLLRQHEHGGGGHRSGWQSLLLAHPSKLSSLHLSALLLSCPPPAEERLPAEASAVVGRELGRGPHPGAFRSLNKAHNAPQRRARLPRQPPARDDPDRFPACRENKLGARAQFQARQPLAIARPFHLKLGVVPFKAAFSFPGASDAATAGSLHLPERSVLGRGYPASWQYRTFFQEELRRNGKQYVERLV